MKSEGLRQSQKHERRLAAKYDGQRAAASGAFWSRKNDVRSGDFVIEHKYTGAKASIIIKKTWLDDVSREAIKESRMAVLAFHLGGQDYMVLDEDTFDALYEGWKESQ